MIHYISTIKQEAKFGFLEAINSLFYLLKKTVFNKVSYFSKNYYHTKFSVP